MSHKLSLDFFSMKKILARKFSKNDFLIFKICFFSMEKKVEKKNGSSYRCRILSGIDFSHPWSDLTTPGGSLGKYTFFPLLRMRRGSPSEPLEFLERFMKSQDPFSIMEKTIYFSREPPEVVRSLQGCEKSIPDKILHG